MEDTMVKRLVVLAFEKARIEIDSTKPKKLALHMHEKLEKRYSIGNDTSRTFYRMYKRYIMNDFAIGVPNKISLDNLAKYYNDFEYLDFLDSQETLYDYNELQDLAETITELKAIFQQAEIASGTDLLKLFKNNMGSGSTKMDENRFRELIKEVVQKELNKAQRRMRYGLKGKRWFGKYTFIFLGSSQFNLVWDNIQNQIASKWHNQDSALYKTLDRSKSVDDFDNEFDDDADDEF